MSPGALFKRPGPAAATPSIAPLATHLYRRCVHQAPGLVLAQRRNGQGFVTRRLTGAANKRPSIATSAAATAAGAFAEDDGPVAVLKRRVQQLRSSPYDKEIWAVALPALVAMLLEPVMNAINAGLVGHLGTQQLSALSLGSLAVTLCTFFYTFLLFLTVPEIAAAVVKKDDDEVSCIAAKSLWIALVCGVISSAAMFAGAGSIVSLLKPPEAAVAAFATDYIKIRSLAIPAVLLGFVSTGVFRGFRDTRTPLFGAIVSAAASLGLNVLFLYVLQMGLVGSAIATTAAQLVSCGLLVGALLRGGRVQPRHLSRLPPLAAMLPSLKLGAVLGARNIISFGMVIYASALSIRLGSSYQAAFEVIRQVWILAIQFFECLNVAAQALCASYLGKEERMAATLLLNRLLTLGVCVGAVAGAAVWAAHGPLIAFFTRDPEVVAHVMAALPMICLFFPIDAAASIMDGSLLAAKQSNYMSAVQIAGSVVQYGVMSYLAATGNVTPLTVWSALKILIVLRVAGGAVRNYLSPKSGYVPLEAAAARAAAPAAPAAAPLPQAAAEPQRASAAAMPAPLPGAEPAPAAVGGTAVQVPTAATPTALQSFEDDVMVLACAAATSATDMNPDLLSLKQRQAASGDAAATVPHASSTHHGDVNGGNGDRQGVNGGDGAPAVSTPTPAVTAAAAVTAATTSSSAG